METYSTRKDAARKAYSGLPQRSDEEASPEGISSMSYWPKEIPLNARGEEINQTDRYLASVLEANFADSGGLQLAHQSGQFRLSKNCGVNFGHHKYYLVEIGPGLFPAEEHRIHVTLSNKQHVALQAQSATKVMPTRDSKSAKVDLKITAMDRSSLIYICEPTIMLPNSSLEFCTDLHLGKDARLIFTDIIGQPFPQIDDALNGNVLNTQLRIFFEDKLLYADSIVVESNPIYTATQSWQHVFSNAMCMGTIYVGGYPASKVEKILRNQARSVTDDRSSIEVTISSITPELLLARVCSITSDSIKQFFESLIEIITSQDP